MTEGRETAETIWRRHVDQERNGLPHVDGCFYCGGQHPTDCCQSPDRDEFWNSQERGRYA